MRVLVQPLGGIHAGEGNALVIHHRDGTTETLKMTSPPGLTYLTLSPGGQVMLECIDMTPAADPPAPPAAPVGAGETGSGDAPV